MANATGDNSNGNNVKNENNINMELNNNNNNNSNNNYDNLVNKINNNSKCSVSNNKTSLEDATLCRKIFNKLVQMKSNENVIISPILLEATLALLYLGADGATANELKYALQLKRFSSNAKMANYYAANLCAATKETDTKMQLNNKILLNELEEQQQQQPQPQQQQQQQFIVADEFKKIAQKYFNTNMEKFNLKNFENLHKYIATAIEVTTTTILHNQIKELLQQQQQQEQQQQQQQQKVVKNHELKIGIAALLLLASNFKFKWFLPFSAYRSGSYEFHANATHSNNNNNNNNSTADNDNNCTYSIKKSVPMLFDDDMFVKFGEFRELDARAIELPYEHDDELAMLLLLPNKRDGLSALMCTLQTVDLNTLTERMQMESVQVLLPKFKIDFVCNLRTLLEELGILTIFSEAANFKNLLHENCKKSLHFADIVHRTHIEVNESGSEPPTNVIAQKPIVISNSINSKQKFFRADHPFYFAIRNSEITYYEGCVTTC